MKKLLLLFITSIVLAACGSTPKESIIDIADRIIGTAPEINGNVYTYNNVSEKALYKDYKELKESIDKALNALPSETKEREVTANGTIYTSYKLETPKVYVLLWVDIDSKFIQITVKDK